MTSVSLNASCQRNVAVLFLNRTWPKYTVSLTTFSLLVMHAKLTVEDIWHLSHLTCKLPPQISFPWLPQTGLFSVLSQSFIKVINRKQSVYCEQERCYVLVLNPGWFCLCMVGVWQNEHHSTFVATFNYSIVLSVIICSKLRNMFHEQWVLWFHVQSSGYSRVFCKAELFIYLFCI